MTRKLVVPAVFLFALAYSFITAPFRGADEFNHFFRAYHVSTGRILAHRAAYGVIGGELPASLLNLATLAADFPSMPDIKLSAAQFRSANRIQLNESERVVTNFSNTTLYSPLVYLPSAIGIAFGRLVSAHPLWLFYLAPLSECIGCLGAAWSRHPNLAFTSKIIRRLSVVTDGPLSNRYDHRRWSHDCP